MTENQNAARKKPRRRTVRRSVEIEQRILEHVAAGESLTQACARRGMPDRTAVRYWAVTDPVFGEKFRTALAVRAFGWADRLIEEIDRPPVVSETGKVDSGEVQLRRLRVDSWKWLLARMLPKVYGDRLQLAGDAGSPLELRMSDSEALDKVLSLLAVAKSRQLRGEEPRRAGNGQGAREVEVDEPPEPEPRSRAQPSGPLDAVPRQLLRLAEQGWTMRRQPGPTDVVAAVDDQNGGVRIARRHGDWVAPVASRLQDARLLDELQAERAALVIDPAGYGRTLLDALRERGVGHVTEADVDLALGRFLQALGETTETGEPAPRVVLPPSLSRVELRAVVATYCPVQARAAPPSFFDDPALRRRESRRDDEWSI